MFPNVQTIRLLEAAGCDFNKVVLRHGCFLVHLLLIFRIPFPRTPLGGCLLIFLVDNLKNNFKKKKLKKKKKKIQKKTQLKLQWGYAFGTLVFQNH